MAKGSPIEISLKILEGLGVVTNAPRRAAIGIGLSLFALATSAVFVGLAEIPLPSLLIVLKPRWDSILIPGFVLFTCVPSAVIGGLA